MGVPGAFCVGDRCDRAQRGRRTGFLRHLRALISEPDLWVSTTYRIADGKIAESWGVTDSVAFQKFLGTYGKSE